jgi:hypothetical protein
MAESHSHAPKEHSEKEHPEATPPPATPPPYPGHYYHPGFNPLYANSNQAVYDITRLSLASTQAHAVMGAGLASVIAKLGTNIHGVVYSGIYGVPQPGAPGYGPAAGQPAGYGYQGYQPYPCMAGSPLLLSRYLADALAETAQVVAQAADSFAKVYGAGSIPGAVHPAPPAQAQSGQVTREAAIQVTTRHDPAGAQVTHPEHTASTKK